VEGKRKRGVDKPSLIMVNAFSGKVRWGLGSGLAALGLRSCYLVQARAALVLLGYGKGQGWGYGAGLAALVAACVLLLFARVRAAAQRSSSSSSSSSSRPMAHGSRRACARCRAPSVVSQVDADAQQVALKEGKKKWGKRRGATLRRR